MPGTELVLGSKLYKNEKKSKDAQQHRRSLISGKMMPAKESSILVRLTGGLGNQLHTFTTAKMLLDPHNLRNFNLDIAGLPLQPRQLRSSIFDLGPINCRKVSSRLDFQSRAITRRAYQSTKDVSVEDGVLLVRSVLPTRKILESHDGPIDFAGFFGGWGYLKKEPEAVTKFFTSAPKVTQLSQAGSSLAIHVRLGDYQKHATSYGILDHDYYLNAAQAFAGEPGGIRDVSIFTDSKGRAQALADKLAREFHVAVKVYGPTLSASSVLRSLVESTYFVGSNSSLSWWVAFFRGRGVDSALPWPWFKNISQPDDFLPPWVVAHPSKFQNF